jgi:tRNA A37 threonylcarbamoyladenosine biosynthesis protein TsaE
MATIEAQVRNADKVIVENIEASNGARGLLAQNLLSQLRNFIEGLLVMAHAADTTEEFHFDKVGPAAEYARATASLRLLSRFHGLLQASTSHYTLDTDPSERLMLKYYEYLIRTRDLASKLFGLSLLKNLEKFPLNTDPALQEYHEKIAARVDEFLALQSPDPRTERYYIHSSRPFFVGGQIYYEVTFSLAHNRTSKYDRNIGFTDIDVTDKYAASLELAATTIDVFSQALPVLIIRSWTVSIRPCELDNFASLFGPVSTKVSPSRPEYRNLMSYLTATRSSLLDLIDLADENYAQVRDWALNKSKGDSLIFGVLDQARALIRSDRSGSRLIRYLMLRMKNETIKDQRDPTPNGWMSNLRVTSVSSPFDQMPFCTSPKRHNPTFADLMETFDSAGRKHELLARRVKINVEDNGIIYTPDDELQRFGDLDALIATHNSRLPPTPRHAPRKLAHDMGHVFIVGYEDESVAIIEKMQEIAASGVLNHSANVLDWIQDNPLEFTDPLKSAALTALFENSRVALIYGAAGTGKSTMVNHIARYFEQESKLFLAHTNPAVDNLKRRVEAPRSTFSTVHSHVKDGGDGAHYDLVVIDECSTVSNSSLLKVLECTSFNLLVLVGDVYQIEAIEFGNWFSTLRSYIPPESVFELTKPFRTSDPSLLTFWDRVRNLDDRIEESISQNGYAGKLGDELFHARRDDEIVLCLNYDGLYGINNVNRFLQASNPSPPVEWSEATYKVGDPVLFNETNRFGGVIFNNLKGTIVGIDTVPGRITFDVEIDREVTTADVMWSDLRLVGDSIVSFDVLQRGNTDEDDNTSTTIVPFGIAYAVSIHKAQGLEYDSVKVVITDATQESISHSIFYTAITRTREHLTIFWTPEIQQRVLSRLAVHENSKDDNLLRTRRGVAAVAKRPKVNKSRPKI